MAAGAGGDRGAVITARSATPDLHLHGWSCKEKYQGFPAGVHPMQLPRGRLGSLKACCERVTSSKLVGLVLKASELFPGFEDLLSFKRIIKFLPFFYQGHH